MKALSEKQTLAAQMLCGGARSKDVAAAVGVTPETISHWKRDPVFRGFANSLRNDAHLAARDALRTLGISAVSTLAELMGNSKVDDVRRKAAVDVLNMLGHSDPQAAFNECSWPEEPAGKIKS